MSPGAHVLRLLLRLDGTCSDTRPYKFEIKSAHSFTVAESKPLRVDVIASLKGDESMPIEQRPDVGFVEGVRSVAVPIDSPPIEVRTEGADTDSRSHGVDQPQAAPLR